MRPFTSDANGRLIVQSLCRPAADPCIGATQLHASEINPGPRLDSYPTGQSRHEIAGHGSGPVSAQRPLPSRHCAHLPHA